MDKILDLWGSLPQAAQLVLAGIGAIAVAQGLGSFLRFVLNVFVLSGYNVSLGCLHGAVCILTTFLGIAFQVRQEGHLGRCHRRIRWNRQGVRHTARREGLQRRPCLAHPVEARRACRRAQAEVLGPADEDSRDGLHKG